MDKTIGNYIICVLWVDSYRYYSCCMQGEILTFANLINNKSLCYREMSKFCFFISLLTIYFLLIYCSQHLIVCAMIAYLRGEPVQKKMYSRFRKMKLKWSTGKSIWKLWFQVWKCKTYPCFYVCIIVANLRYLLDRLRQLMLIYFYPL